MPLAAQRATDRLIIGRAKKNSGVGREVPITAKWGLVGRGQNATGQHLSSAFWHNNSSAAGKESEIDRDGVENRKVSDVVDDQPKDGSSSHE
jgi:hypothetical protein